MQSSEQSGLRPGIETSFLPWDCNISNAGNQQQQHVCIPLFSLCEQAKPSCLVTLLLKCAGDIKSKLGPDRQVYVCPICKNQLKRRDVSVLCAACNKWIHIRCSGLQSVKDYRQKTFSLRHSSTVTPTPPVTHNAVGVQQQPRLPCSACHKVMTKTAKPVHCSACGQCTHLWCSGLKYRSLYRTDFICPSCRERLQGGLSNAVVTSQVTQQNSAGTGLTPNAIRPSISRSTTPARRGIQDLTMELQWNYMGTASGRGSRLHG